MPVVNFDTLDKAALIDHLTQGSQQPIGRDPRLEQMVAHLHEETGIDEMAVYATLEECRIKVLEFRTQVMGDQFSEEELRTLCKWSCDELGNKQKELVAAMEKVQEEVQQELGPLLMMGQVPDTKFEHAPEMPLEEMSMDQLARHAVSMGETELRESVEQQKAMMKMMFQQAVNEGQMTEEQLEMVDPACDYILERSLTKRAQVISKLFDRTLLLKHIERLDSDLTKKSQGVEKAIEGYAQITQMGAMFQLMMETQMPSE